MKIGNPVWAEIVLVGCEILRFACCGVGEGLNATTGSL